MRTTLYQVSTPYYVAGIIADEDSGKIVEAAPILGWVLTKKLTIDQFKEYASRKGIDILECSTTKD